MQPAADHRCTGGINPVTQRPPPPCWSCALRTTPSPDQPRIALIEPPVKFASKAWACEQRLVPAGEGA